MHIVRKLTPRLLFCFFYLIIPCTLFAAERDTSVITPLDTSKTRAHWLTNRDFNDIYIQNLRPSSAGQEFFDPHKTLLVADVTANFILLNTPKLPFFFVGSARINVRLFAGEGSPVKSPSYMPGGTLYFRLNRQSYNPRFFSVSYTHHSNGQEGPTLNPNGTFNTDSGKFTTNFYTFTYHTGKRTDLADLIITRYDAIGLELHSGIIDEGYIKALKGKYGYARVNGDWLYNIARANKDPIDPDKKVFSNWQRLDFQFAYIADKYDDYNEFDLKKRLNVVLKYYYQFPFMQNVSVLVGAGYRGQDEYNIFFQDSYAYAVVGFAAGLSFNMHQK